MERNGTQDFLEVLQHTVCMCGIIILQHTGASPFGASFKAKTGAAQSVQSVEDYRFADLPSP
jgi:hypothetical protein